MASAEFATATIEHTFEHAVVSPAPAKVEGSDIAPHRRYVTAVTEQHGLQVEEIDEESIAPIPFRAKGTRTVSEVTSLLDELTRRPLTPGISTLWGDYEKGVVTAVYNDHSSTVPGWRDDRLMLQLAMDPDWVAWHKVSGEWFGQEKLGDILEELLHTVIAPDQAELLEVVDSIKASTKGSFESRIDRQDGAQALTYTHEVTASAGRSSSKRLEIPKQILLRLRPWEGHVDTYDITAMFKLRVSGGDLSLGVKLQPTQQILRTAWADMLKPVVAQTAIPVLAHRNTK